MQKNNACFAVQPPKYLDITKKRNLAIVSTCMDLCRTTELPGDSGWETILGNEDSQQQEV